MVLQRFDEMRKMKKPQLNIQEAHILWRILADRYTIVDHINRLQDFTHDKDFLFYLHELEDGYRKDIEMLVTKLDKYSIPGPEPGTKSQYTYGNTEAIHDKETAQILFGFMRLDISLKLSSLKDATTNDEVRNTILHLIRASMKKIDFLIKYLKLKNWISLPPLYPYADPEAGEKLAVNEVYLLWDHLVFRYMNIRQTRNFIAFASDPDLKLLLELGLGILEKQAKTLEQKLLHFGITLPRGYTPVTLTIEQKELLEDRFIFDVILRGMQDALALHGLTLLEIIVNDNIRAFFHRLTLQEIGYTDKMIAYGKLKEWLFIAPKYKIGF